MDLPSEPEQLSWREAFWRLCALLFVRFRLGAGEPEDVAPALAEAPAESE